MLKSVVQQCDSLG